MHLLSMGVVLFVCFSGTGEGVTFFRRKGWILFIVGMCLCVCMCIVFVYFPMAVRWNVHFY